MPRFRRKYYGRRRRRYSRRYRMGSWMARYSGSAIGRRKRRGGKKGLSKKSGLIVPRWGSGKAAFPEKIRIPLRFMDTGYTVTTAATLPYNGRHVFRGSSIYDPDYTGAGVQPYYHDVFEGIYKHYRVFASKIKLYVYAEAGTRIGHCFIIPNSGYGVFTYDGRDDLAQHYKAKQMVMRFDNSRNRTMPRLVNYCKTRELFDDVMDEDFRANFGQNPTENWYWHVYFYSDYAAASHVYQFDVKITYYCKLYARANVDES